MKAMLQHPFMAAGLEVLPLIAARGLAVQVCT